VCMAARGLGADLSTIPYQAKNDLTMSLAIVVKINLSALWVTVCRTARGPGADFSIVSRHSTDVVQQVPVVNYF
jgi:hypothetical protein